MRIQNRYFSAAFKALIALSGWMGILLDCGVFTGRADFSPLRYYTLLTNLLIALYFSAAARRAWQGARVRHPNLKGALMMGITVTGVVFHLLLSEGIGDLRGQEAVANQLLHTVTPLTVVLDWLLFDEKGRYGAWSPVLWTILPDLYFAWATAYGFLSGDRFLDGARFPYFFIDYDTIGVGGVLGYVLALNAAFVALGYAFVGIDRLLRKR